MFLLFAFIFFIIAVPARAGLETDESRELLIFSEKVIAGEEEKIISNKEIIEKTEAMYQVSLASLDNLLLQKKEAADALFNKKEIAVSNRAKQIEKSKIKKIKKWFKKIDKSAQSKNKMKKRIKTAKKNISKWLSEETERLEKGLQTAKAILQRDYDTGFDEINQSADRIYKYLGEDPLGQDFFATMTIEPIRPEDAQKMRETGIDTYRMSLDWRFVQSYPSEKINWSNFDYVMRTTANAGIRVLPAFHSTPPGWGSDWRQLPIETEAQRSGWVKFISGAVKRYGPGGDFWRENQSIRPIPIENWQIWNEANDYWFTQPVDPNKYSQLLKLSATTIRAIDPNAKIMASSLFGPAKDRPGESFSPASFLIGMHRAGALDYIDSLSLHPYSRTAEEMARDVNNFVDLSNSLKPLPLYITEVGWQSDNATIFGVGNGPAQAEEMRRAYAYLLRHHRRLNLRMLSWFAWKDTPRNIDTCLACYESGLFEESYQLVPKPSWYMLRDIIASS